MLRVTCLKRETISGAAASAARGSSPQPPIASETITGAGETSNANQDSRVRVRNSSSNALIGTTISDESCTSAGAGFAWRALCPAVFTEIFVSPPSVAEADLDNFGAMRTKSSRTKSNSGRSNNVVAGDIEQHPRAEIAASTANESSIRPPSGRQTFTQRNSSSSTSTMLQQQVSSLSTSSNAEGELQQTQTAAAATLATIPTQPTAVGSSTRRSSGRVNSHRRTRSNCNSLDSVPGNASVIQSEQAPTAVSGEALAITTPVRTRASRQQASVRQTPTAVPTAADNGGGIKVRVVTVEAELLSRGPAAAVHERYGRDAAMTTLISPRRFAPMFQLCEAEAIPGSPLMMAATPVPARRQTAHEIQQELQENANNNHLYVATAATASTVATCTCNSSTAVTTNTAAAPSRPQLHNMNHNPNQIMGSIQRSISSPGSMNIAATMTSGAANGTTAAAMDATLVEVTSVPTAAAASHITQDIDRNTNTQQQQQQQQQITIPNTPIPQLIPRSTATSVDYTRRETSAHRRLSGTGTGTGTGGRGGHDGIADDHDGIIIPRAGHMAQEEHDHDDHMDRLIAAPPAVLMMQHSGNLQQMMLLHSGVPTPRVDNPTVALADDSAVVLPIDIPVDIVPSSMLMQSTTESAEAETAGAHVIIGATSGVHSLQLDTASINALSSFDPDDEVAGIMSMTDSNNNGANDESDADAAIIRLVSPTPPVSGRRSNNGRNSSRGGRILS